MIELTCGKCCWMQIPPIPKGTKIDVKRGYCTFNPPAVFPMPQQQGNLADIQGQTKMGVVPLMQRPIVQEDEPMCGRFAPNEETMKELGLDKPGCGACTTEGAKCEC